MSFRFTSGIISFNFTFNATSLSSYIYLIIPFLEGRGEGRETAFGVLAGHAGLVVAEPLNVTLTLKGPFSVRSSPVCLVPLNYDGILLFVANQT